MPVASEIFITDILIFMIASSYKEKFGTDLAKLV